MKYSVLCGVSGHCDGGNIVKEATFQEEYLPQINKHKQKRQCVFYKGEMRGRLYTNVKTATLLCASMGVARSTIQGEITDVM